MLCRNRCLPSHYWAKTMDLKNLTDIPSGGFLANNDCPRIRLFFRGCWGCFVDQMAAHSDARTSNSHISKRGIRVNVLSDFTEIFRGRRQSVAHHPPPLIAPRRRGRARSRDLQGYGCRTKARGQHRGCEPVHRRSHSRSRAVWQIVPRQPPDQPQAVDPLRS